MSAIFMFISSYPNFSENNPLQIPNLLIVSIFRHDKKEEKEHISIIPQNDLPRNLQKHQQTTQITIITLIHSGKLTWQWETEPFGDAFPIKNGGFPWLC